jgi:hypothetical protein
MSTSSRHQDERGLSMPLARHRASGAAGCAPNHAVLDAVLAGGADIRSPSAWPPLMDQRMASEFLSSVCGVRLAPKSLQKRRVVGGSPPFRKFGARVVYPRDLLKAWADEQTGPVVRSTSDLAGS